MPFQEARPLCMFFYPNKVLPQPFQLSPLKLLSACFGTIPGIKHESLRYLKESLSGRFEERLSLNYFPL